MIFVPLMGVLLGQSYDGRPPNINYRSTTSTIETAFKSKSGRYLEKLDGKDKTAFLWGISVTLSAYAQGLKVDSSYYLPKWKAIRSALDRYWTSGSPGGYSVLPGQERHPDRYYDDNAWVAWACYEAYSVTHEAKDLDRGDKAYRFALSGWSDDLGGGLFWREKKKESKNACINAPMAAICYERYSLFHDQADQEMGDKLIGWVQHHLISPDGLVWDNVKLDGRVEKAKWTYNSACLIRALVRRYAVTHSEADRSAAHDLLEASVTKWVNSESHLVDDPSMFAQHLVDALYEAGKVFGEPTWIKQADAIVDAVSSRCMTAEGVGRDRWDAKDNPNEKPALLFQSSILRVQLSKELAHPSRL